MVSVIKLFKNHHIEAKLYDGFELGIYRKNPTLDTEEFKEWYRTIKVASTNSHVTVIKGEGQYPCEWDEGGIERMKLIYQG